MFLLEHNACCRLELSRAEHDEPRQEDREQEEPRPSIVTGDGYPYSLLFEEHPR